MIEQMAIATALPGVNSLGRGRSVTAIFLSTNRCYLQLSPHCPKTRKNEMPKMNKKSLWEVKKNSRFVLMHGTLILILRSWCCEARETMFAEWEHVLGTSPVD